MIKFYESDAIVIVYEGNTEKYILEMLLEQDAFAFESWQLLDNRMFKRTNTQHRNALENQYFPMDFGKSRLVVLLVQDDDADLKIDDVFRYKITGPVFVVTKPEIEMLMVHSLGQYDAYQKARSKNHQLKPSEFVAGEFGVTTSRLKSQTFVMDFYEKHSLIDAIKRHSEKARREPNQYFLNDILK
ncbi:MAG: hypothetical protein LBM27_04955 [Lactobacillaceae bacterium]|jgi:hypothetical protein|nr:hypothetical protein [Lactobacillaceae bacterium]